METFRRKFNELLTGVKLLLNDVKLVFNVVTVLLIVRTAPVLGIAVKREASPTCLPKIVPAEIVEKNPKLVDILTAEILLTPKRKLTELLFIVVT